MTSPDPLRERLKRQRREAARASQPIPVWLQARLGARARAVEEAAGDVSVDPPERLEEHGAFAARVESRGDEEPHGEWCPAEVEGLAPDAFARFARDGSLDAVHLRDAVYLDIETTGLSGGAGVYPFLVALGTFEGAEFRVWQGFLRSPEEEPALLAAAAERIGAASCIVSFFGKSFDRHRLEDKMRLHGIDPPFDGLPHLDLYHPCARLYRGGLPDGRLATMERALCGVRREDDLSGAHAPAAWFDFLAGRAHRLEAVFRHNLDDVLSLVTLAAHLGRAADETRADGTPLDGPAGMRALGLARLAADRGDRAEALAWFDRAIDRLEGDLRPVRVQRADLLRLTGARDRACDEYAALAAERADEHAVHALIELAKDAEHRGRDLNVAAERCATARRILERSCTGQPFARFKRDLDQREVRLRQKNRG